MSVRRNAPSRDRVEDQSTTLMYEGHDRPRRPRVPRAPAARWIRFACL